MKQFEKNMILDSQPIKEALVRLNGFGVKDSLTLFVVDEQHILKGTVTDGDIRRGLLRDPDLNKPIGSIMHVNFRFLRRNKFSLQDIRALRENDIELVPLLDDNSRLIKVFNLKEKKTVLPLDVIIMAGGKGVRLHPLTLTVPKPLLKVGNKPIIEHNIDRLNQHGVENIYISIKYLGEQLVSYFGSGESKGLNIRYLEENEPLGTIGAVSMVEKFENDHVLIMNSDLLTNIDFEDMFHEFMQKDADLMVATVPYHVNVPYAVLETDDEQILSFKEKPTYTYYSNAGIYLVKRSLLHHIPRSFYNATDFLDLLIKSGHKVCYYSILGYWLDIGKHEDFQKAQEDIKHIKM